LLPPQYGKSGGGLAGYGTGWLGANNAVLYDPNAPLGARFSCLGETTISRYFLNSALLLPSGDVLVAGSEQTQPGTHWCDPPGQYTPEFRAERFRLPYAYASNRPIVSDVRDAAASATAPPVVSVPVFGYGLDVAITYRYSGACHEEPCHTPQRSGSFIATATNTYPVRSFAQILTPQAMV
jgi:hypothetical protein